ncbi:hypothetical protein NDU88_006149 [Pleurodeles waltl]|uniref:Spore coat protein n=1 Tax=Pleurodeles waltl TaxID=8319 RepID=A0AAV7NSF7_PLEWA|nr:hypothetical protein NDU88_006149 [Pleurodeles waltl]
MYPQHPNKSDKILETIEKTRELLEIKEEAVAILVGLLHEDQQNLSDRMTQNEPLLQDLHPKMTDMGKQILDLTKRFIPAGATPQDD